MISVLSNNWQITELLHRLLRTLVSVLLDASYGTWDKNLFHLSCFDAVSTETKSRMASRRLDLEHLEQTAEMSVKYTGKLDDLSDKTTSWDQHQNAFSMLFAST